jgi:hypothetical protein
MYYTAWLCLIKSSFGVTFWAESRIFGQTWFQRGKRGSCETYRALGSPLTFPDHLVEQN